MNAVDYFFVEAIKSIQHPLLTAIARVVTNLSSYFVILALVALFLHRKKKESAMNLVVYTLVDMFLLVSLKSLVNRPRPEGHPPKALLSLRPNSSFPSGHTSRAFFLAPFLSREYGVRLLWYTLAILVAFSRIYLGVHYFTDIVFGAITGTFVFWFANRMQIRERICHFLDARFA